jgi:preprotein translocase subunit YajC
MEQLAGILPLLLIFVVFYFLLIRPQQKKLKEHKNMIANLKKGDRIVTQGGIIGSIYYVNDDGTLSVEIADNVNVKVAKGMVADIAAK